MIYILSFKYIYHQKKVQIIIYVQLVKHWNRVPQEMVEPPGRSAQKTTTNKQISHSHILCLPPLWDPGEN